jgi:4-hydroxy-3-methylbut-2-en-1-yl diphosphate reductase
MPEPPIRVLLANPRGFCAGVEMAIECLDRALELFGPPVFVYHYIVHNKFVVEGFERRGVVFVNSLDDVPAGSTLVYSAHGVSPEIERQSKGKKYRVLDATCPLVTKVHREARDFALRGFTILLIGHKGHDEVAGVLDEAENILVIETVEDAESIEVRDPQRVAYLTQTTLSLDDAAQIIATLRRRFPGIAGPATDDICYATQNRQHAVGMLARRADLAIVIGSQNSSNSQRLAEVARGAGIPAYLVDGPEQIERDWLQGVTNILLTSGRRRGASRKGRTDTFPAAQGCTGRAASPGFES